MKERCLLGEKRVFQPCTRLPLFRNFLCFWDHSLAVSVDQKSPAAVRWLPQRERRCVEASLVAISSLFVMPRSPRGRLWK